VFNVLINNGSKREIKRVETSLIQETNYSAQRHSIHFLHTLHSHRDIMEKQESRVIMQYKEDCHMSKLSANNTYQRMLAIPACVPSFNICPIIQVSYLLKVKMIAKGTINDSISVEIPVLIGSIPVRQIVSPTAGLTAPQQFNDLTPEQLAPPVPSAPPSYDESQLTYADCQFGRGTLADDDNEKADYTPKYIFYPNLS
jgi:hypothetical protein